MNSRSFTSRARALLVPALLAGTLLAAGCGNDVPDDAVARVGDSTVPKQEFERWMKNAAQSTPPQPGLPTSLPDAPDFERCIAEQRKQPVPEGARRPTEAQLKEQCQQQYDQLKNQVMEFLVTADWIEQEARRRGITVSDEEVRQRFEEQKKQSFPDDKAYQEFLRTSGQSEQDLLARVRLDVISNKVRESIIKGKTDVSEAEIRKFYEQNKQQFAQPERRDMNIVVTKERSQARRALQALKNGQSWRRVARRYSIDEGSKAAGGKLPGVSRGQQEEALDKAVFAASEGEIKGPIRTDFGYYLFEVTDIDEPEQRTLRQARQQIEDQLRQEKEQRALDRFIREFENRYKEMTVCADDFRIDRCSNAPEEEDAEDTPDPRESPPPPPQAPPQGQQGPQGQQPPQGGQGGNAPQIPVPEER